MKWVTKAHVHIDQIACPWLIKRFIDTEAEFFFVAKEYVNDLALREKAIPFGVPETGSTNQHNPCSFVAFLEKYSLNEPALLKMGSLIHAASTADFKSHPFASCLDALSQGYSLLVPDDLENIEQQFALYDALYNYFRMDGKKETTALSSKKKSETELLFSLPIETKKEASK